MLRALTLPAYMGDNRVYRNQITGDTVMKKYTCVLLALLIVLISGLRADAKNILKDIFRLTRNTRKST